MNQEESANKQASRVLLCDDSKLIRMTAQKMLDDHFDLILAEDGEDAWQKISEDDTIQLVFTDLKMPNLDGFGLIKRARTCEDEHIRNLPMIVITGASEDEDIKREIFEVGATDFITKPFKASTLIARANAHTSYRKIKTELQKNTNIDALTGALNENGIVAQLEKDCAFTNRHNESIAVMVFELDNFDDIFSNIGQKISDVIVREVAKLLIGSLRKEDSVARIGLARFLISLPMAKSDSIVKLARRLADRINAFKLKAGEQPIELSSSAGIATGTKGATLQAKELIKCAEHALENARSVGLGEVQLLKVEEGDGEADIDLQSIDSVLDHIEKDLGDLNEKQIGAVINRLAPLIAQMNAEQKQMLIRQ